MQKYIKYSLLTLGLLLGGLPTMAYNIDPSLPKQVGEQIKGDLAFMATIQGEQGSQLHQQIFGKFEGANYSKFFESRVTDIGYGNCGNSNAVACVNLFLGSSKMWITDNYIKFSHPQIARLMVIYHEARHTEDDNDNWPHASCPKPFKNDKGEDMKSIWTGAALAGQPACDTTPLGSYGSSLILLKNISKFCTNCGDKVKMDAGIYADDQYGRIIDEQSKKQIKTDIY